MSTKREHLKELFHTRQLTYNKISTKILKQLESDVLQGISAYFADMDEVGEGRTLKWNEVGYLDQYNVMILMGTIHYAVGTKVELEDGETVSVTEELAPYFHRIIRVGIPLELVETNKDAVRAFLHERDKDSDVDEEYDEELAKEAPLLDIQLPTHSEFEFDFDSLSEEQQRKIFVPKRGKVN